MIHSITLYHSESADIKVDIEARFDGDTLIIDGYDTGKRVKEYWGHSDYEYTLMIPPKSVQQLYDLMNVWPGDKQSLLREVAKRYQTNTCFSEIRRLPDDNAIQSEGFSWI